VSDYGSSGVPAINANIKVSRRADAPQITITLSQRAWVGNHAVDQLMSGIAASRGQWRLVVSLNGVFQ